MTARTITDFRELNKRIVRRPYPIPKISTTLQELKGFTYATALDLNMGYYTIRLDPQAVEMFTIIFPWGKYSYLRLPMGYAGSADIFQAEMMDLMEALEYGRAFDNLLVITRGTLEDHLEKLGEVLRRLREAGLKGNAAKSFFCTQLHIDQRRDQTPTKESTGNTRAKSVKQCQGVKTLLRKLP